jgi:large subunit ribosomal protein L29
MTIMMTKDELKKLDVAALESDTNSLKKEFFTLKLGVMTGQVKDFSQFQKLRRQIARLLTFATQKRGKKQNMNKSVVSK